MKIEVTTQLGERDFEVTPRAEIANLLYLGTYTQGFGGQAYLDITSSKVVLVPNRVITTEHVSKDIKTVQADKGDTVITVKPSLPLDRTKKTWAVKDGEWGYIESAEQPGAVEETETAEADQSADEAF
jgi:hypothetical protein